ncbi:MAG: hypothetical protein FD161_767 [Limisphaerales bacterium]|nr:MAG: hypothetical protein FD161_767 [Limisphaerales bacterium]KAG0510125.1 MAG: hypothetical protein E1N63_767 [Limisphaerales bacterium]TXT52968.1 MAG: hypothetical protein FD140_76 [Limisphaerales bacterium]
MKGRLPQAFLDRTKHFGAQVIRLFVKLPRQREEVSVLARQMLRAGTSVAGHVREANRARSTAEFVSKLGGACQEADETHLWIEYLREECRIPAEQTTPIEQEAVELLAIMAAMIRKCG